MKQRIITAIVLLAVFVPLVAIGGVPFQVLMVALAAGATYELLHVAHDPDPKYYLFAVLGVFIIGSLLFSKKELVDVTYIVLYLIVLLTAGIFDSSMNFMRLSYYFTSGTLVAVGLRMVYYMRMSLGLDYVLLLACATLGADTFAYFVGRAIGKHKLNERLSPKKTIEGSIGGIVLGGALALAYGFFAKMQLPMVSLVIISFVLSTTGQIGDLSFSSIKRSFGIKDYSHIFPGHGGILDRFDSIIFNAMVLGYLLNYIPH